MSKQSELAQDVAEVAVRLHLCRDEFLLDRDSDEYLELEDRFNIAVVRYGNGGDMWPDLRTEFEADKK